MRWVEQGWQRGRASHKTYLVLSEREGKETRLRAGHLFSPDKQTNEGEAGHQVETGNLKALPPAILSL